MAKTNGKSNGKQSAKSHQSGGLLKDLAAAFGSVNKDLLTKAAANTQANGSRWEPPDGSYILKIVAGTSIVKAIEPEDDEPYVIFGLGLEIVGTDPGAEALRGKKFERPFFLKYAEDDDGNPKCWAVGEMKAILAHCYESDDIPDDPEELTKLLLGCDGDEFDVSIETRESRKNPGKSFKNWTWSGKVAA